MVLSFTCPSWRARRQVLEMNMPCARGFVVESLKRGNALLYLAILENYQKQV
jgi:hypothetical protein